MKKIRKFVRELEEKPRPDLAKICLASFLVSFLFGFSFGLVFRELRLQTLTVKQEAQKTGEKTRVEGLFKKFSQIEKFFRVK